MNLTTPDLRDYDRFGWRLAIDGSRIAVSAHQDDERGESSGSAYVFLGSELEGRLVPPASRAGDHTSLGLAMSFPRIAVGSPGADDIAGSSGAVDVFEYFVDHWRHETRIVRESSAFDQFGHAIALEGSLMCVSSMGEANAGMVSVYRRGAGGWVRVQELRTGLASSVYGYSLALKNELLVVGAKGDYSAGGVCCGAVYVYDWAGSEFSLVTVLYPPADTRGTLDLYGWSVDTDGARIVVGASNYFNNRVGGPWGRGAAFVYRDFELEHVLEGDVEGDRYGYAVAVDDDIVVVGSPWMGDKHGIVDVYRAGVREQRYVGSAWRAGRAVAADWREVAWNDTPTTVRVEITSQETPMETPMIVPTPSVIPYTHPVDGSEPQLISIGTKVQIGVPIDLRVHLFISNDDDPVPARSDVEIWLHIFDPIEFDRDFWRDFDPATDPWPGVDILLTTGHPAIGPTPEDPDNPRDIELSSVYTLTPSLVDAMTPIPSVSTGDETMYGVAYEVRYGGRLTADALSSSGSAFISAVNLLGDTNLDGVVDVNDQIMVITHWGERANP